MKNPRIKLLIALNLVIICLLVGLFWIVPSLNPTNTTPEYSRTRVGSISLNPNLAWELELLGSKDEEAVFVREQDEKLYVFGNSLSNDFDFLPKIFLVIVDVYGKISDESFFYFGQEGDFLRSAQVCEQGFVLAVEGKSEPYLLIVGLDGLIKQKTDSFLPSFEAVLDFYPLNDGWALLTSPKKSNTKLLRCSFFSTDFSFILANLATSSYSLEPFSTMFSSDGPMVFCNAIDAFGISFPALVRFNRHQSAAVEISDTYAGECKSASVYKGQFLLLSGFGGCSLLQFNLDFEAVSATVLSLNTPRFFIDLDEFSFIVFAKNTTYLLNQNLVRVGSLDAYTPHQHKYVGGGVIFAATDEGGQICLLSFFDGQMGGETRLELGENPQLSLGETRLFCTYHRGGNIIISLLKPL